MGTEENVLQEADRITAGSRHEDYGAAYKEAQRFAQMCEAATGLPIKPEHYHIIMICIKLVRERNRQKRDNLVDIAGYARVGEMFWDEADEIADIQKSIEESGSPSPWLVPGGTMIVPCDGESAVRMGESFLNAQTRLGLKNQAAQRVVEVARDVAGLFQEGATVGAYSPEAQELADAVGVLNELR